MSTERVFDINNSDSDCAFKSSADSDDDNSAMDTMRGNELIKLYKDQLINVHEILGSSENDDMDDDIEKQIDKEELVGLYKDQLVPIEELAPVFKVEASSCNRNVHNITRRVSLGAYLIKFAVPAAVVLPYVEPIFRQIHDNGQCRTMNTTVMLPLKALCLVFILCAPVIIINYRYTLKIDALVHGIIFDLQAKRERHVKYPHICPSAAISVAQIRSNIVNPTHLSTFEDWQCVEEKLNAHPLLRKLTQEERGDFIAYYEILV